MTVDELYEALICPEVTEYLSQEKLPNPQDFLLHAPDHFSKIKSAIADQLISQSKAAKKLPVWSQEKAVLWPPPLSIEQASSEVAAQYKATLMSGEHLVDLTGGSGVDCLAMGNRYKKITYVEQNEWLVKLFSHNAQLLADDSSRFEWHQSQAEESLNLINENSHIYIDPARRDAVRNKVFQVEDCSPDLTRLLPKLRDRSNEILIKLSPMLDLSEGIRQLYPYEIHVISIANECKELLFRVNQFVSDNPKIICVNYIDGQWAEFSYKYQDEATSQSDFGPLKSYLYEPNASLMKAGAFQVTGQFFGLQKLGLHTHLYTSDEHFHYFPGRVFCVLKQDVSGKELKKTHGEDDLHVITRNYPLKAEDLRKKYKLTERGDKFLIAYTDWQNQKKMAVTQLAKNAPA